jgi:hypothetical protein
MPSDPTLKARIERIRQAAHERASTEENYEAAALAQTVLHDTVGAGHPLMISLRDGVASSDWTKIVGACMAVVMLFDQGSLENPRLRIARELEGDVLDVAEAQARAAEETVDAGQKTVRRAVAAFLAGAALEDALRRLSDKVGVTYDHARSSIAKLQGGLYAPSSNALHITVSENKQITAWGDTRNKADHGKFAEITQTEVITMIMGIRSFLDKNLG